MGMNLIEEIIAAAGKTQVKTDEPMYKHNTFRVGGNAKIFVEPESAEQIIKIIQICRQYNEPYYIIGNGSNLIVKDEGYQGTILQLGNWFSRYKLEGSTVTAQSGIMLSRLANVLLENSLKGFEFASGIPGTLGGAVVMNAGAYGGEIKDVILSAKVITPQGELLSLDKEQLELGYRTSVIQKNNYIVTEAVLQLEKGNYDEIKGLMRDYNNRRKEKQPLEYPSAGSTFKRPEGYFAGKLIQDAGLSGYRVGGAMVSEKHNGFVINIGGAVTSDILQLIEDIKRIVYEKMGVRLEEEVKVI